MRKDLGIACLLVAEDDGSLVLDDKRSGTPTEIEDFFVPGVYIPTLETKQWECWK